MKILLTGGAGFIGSNVLKELNKQNYEVFVVDSMAPAKVKNISAAKMLDYSDKAFLTNYLSQRNWIKQFDCIVHLGATSSTTCVDKSIIENNHEFSKELIGVAIESRIPVIYASSASVYGNTQSSTSFGSVAPLSMYALSKALTDNTVERALKLGRTGMSPIVGLRFFNVYGPGEAHKGTQASVIYNWYKQFTKQKRWNLFEGVNQRDFIHVDDVVKIIMWFVDKIIIEGEIVKKHAFKDYIEGGIEGIYDVGTGVASDFRQISDIMEEYFSCNLPWGVPLIEIPDSLAGQYQKYTRADLAPLRDLGYSEPFIDLHDGVTSYIDFLESEK